MQINKLVTIRETLQALQSSTNIARNKSSTFHNDGTSISTRTHTKQMVIWNRRLALVAEKTGLISPVQFGNQKGCMALDALLLKVVTLDCFCLFQLNGATLNNDATACYNNMIPEVSSLHLQSLGLPESAAKCNVLLNHNMRHHIKTKAGITKDRYRHKPGGEIYREGQGKTSPPLTCCSRSSHFSEHYIN
eukprot:5684103-Ditylum_brightwellii.AAC.1